MVILGDFINRGPDSYNCIRRIMKHKEEDGATVLMGNHEKLFLNWLFTGQAENDVYHYYFKETVKSFYAKDNDPTRELNERLMLRRFIDTYTVVVDFLQGLDEFKETDDIFFVHAGVNTALDDYKESSPEVKMNTREDFILCDKKLHKKVVFGHTPSRRMNPKCVDDIWVSEDGDKIGIDGGMSYGGSLNAIRLDAKGSIIESFSFK